MNSTFKVVFNKARGALMVVNEVTSSVQGKGTKTVVAAAVAAMIAGVSGSAMATETDTEIKATDTALKATFTKAEKQTDVASSLIGTSGDKLALKNVTNKDMYAAGSLGERQKFCVHGIIGARQTGASNEHERQTQFS